MRPFARFCIYFSCLLTELVLSCERKLSVSFDRMEYITREIHGVLLFIVCRPMGFCSKLQFWNSTYEFYLWNNSSDELFYEVCGLFCVVYSNFPLSGATLLSWLRCIFHRVLNRLLHNRGEVHNSDRGSWPIARMMERVISLFSPFSASTWQTLWTWVTSTSISVFRSSIRSDSWLLGCFLRLRLQLPAAARSRERPRKFCQ